MRVAVAVVCLALAGPAMAQPTPGQHPSAGDAADRQASARVEEHIADLKKRLAITPAQQPQWDAFAGTLRQNAQETERSYRERQARGPLSAVNDLRAHAAAVRQHGEAVTRLVEPFAALYGVMTLEQRAAADQVFVQFERRARPAPRF